MIKHKFHSNPCESSDGKKFQSKKERNYYQKLLLAQKAGELIFFLRQIPFDLPGNTKYRADFIEFWKDGSVDITDVKGFKTDTYKLKKKQVEALYPIKIKEV